jgi:hypothetical protein
VILLVAIAGIVLTAVSTALTGLAWGLCKLIPWDAEVWLLVRYGRPWCEKSIPMRLPIYDRIMAPPAGRIVLAREIWDPDTRVYLAPDVVLKGLAKRCVALAEELAETDDGAMCQCFHRDAFHVGGSGACVVPTCLCRAFEFPTLTPDAPDATLTG